MLKKIIQLFKLYREEKKLKKVLEDLEAGKITPNEARKAAGLPPVEKRKEIIERSLNNGNN